MQCSICNKKVTEGYAISKENLTTGEKDFIGYFICEICFFAKLNPIITVNPIEKKEGG